MRNKILLPIASAVLASTLVFTLPAQAEENLAPTITNEFYEVETTTNLEDSVIEEAYENQAEVKNEEATEENNEVITPDSFLYNFKVFIEEVRLFFTFDDEKKAELLAQVANERLLQADAVAEKGDLELVKELIKAYEEKITALEELEELSKENESVIDDTYDSVIKETYGESEDVEGSDSESEETVNNNVYKYKLKNIEALTMVYNKVPDHVKPIIQRNLQKAIEKREAHIAKKMHKQNKKVRKTATLEPEELISEVKSTENMDKDVVEVKVTITDKVENGEQVTRAEHIKKKDYEKKDYKIEDKESSNDDSDKSRDIKYREDKEKGKEHNNKSKKDK